MRRMTRLVGVVVLAAPTTGAVPGGVVAQRASGRRAVGAGADPAGRGDPRPLGPEPHLRAERGRPLPGAGLPRRQGSPVPVRGVAAPRHRHRGRDPRPARAEPRPRHAPPHVSRRHGRRSSTTTIRAARPIVEAYVRGVNAYVDEAMRDAGLAARRVQDARHHARQVDAAGGDFTPPGADRQRAQRGDARACHRRARQRRQAARAAAHRGRRAAARRSTR